MSTVGTSPSLLCKLISRREVAEKTFAFHFEKPPGWAFKPGQSVDMTLIDPPETDAEGNTRALSIASSPQEEFLMVTTRMRNSAFKRVLGTMSPGTAVKLDGPFGNLILHNNAAIVFHAAREKRPHRIFLLYSNRRPEDAAFLDELENLEKENPNYKLIATMTGMEKSQRVWKGERGWINEEMLSRCLKTADSPIHYIAGPPGMVAGLRGVLNKAGVDDDDIRAEDFSGY